MVDLTKPLKLESPAGGGTEFNNYPTEIDPTEDYVASKGLALESDASLIDLDGSGNIQFTDNIIGNISLLNTSRRTNRLITQTTHGFDNDFIYHNGTTWTKAQADSLSHCATHFAINIDTDTFWIVAVGEIDATGMTDDASGSLTSGYYYLSQTTSGKVTTKPSTGIAQSLMKINDTNHATVFIQEPYEIEINVQYN